MTFKDYPPRQKAASFNMDEVLAKLKESGGSVARAWRGASVEVPLLPFIARGNS